MSNNPQRLETPGCECSDCKRPTSRHRPIDHIHIITLCWTPKCDILQENATGCTCKSGTPTVTTAVGTKGFCRSCDGFTGRIPGYLVDMDEAAYNIMYRQNRQLIVTPGDVEERRRRREAQRVVERGDDEEWKPRRDVFLLNHSSE
jgi:hypothetical protein